jgi:two-component system sensor histidine kinase MprB
MSLRRRLALSAAAAVAVGSTLSSAAIFLAVRHEARAQIDHGLARRSDALRARPLRALLLGARGPAALGQLVFVQVVPASGAPIGPAPGSPQLPLDPLARDVARGTAPAYYSDVRVGGEHFRVLTRRLIPGYALRLGRPLAETDRTLRALTVVFLIVIAACSIAAGLFGLAVAGTALRPLRRLAAAIHSVRETGTLDKRVDVTGNDELAHLSKDFNGMLASLEQSLNAQKQFIADASHELRTPLTSLRANAELLARPDGITPEQRSRLQAAISTQIGEMTSLIANLIELARGQESPLRRQELRLDELVETVVTHTRANRPQIHIRSDLEPTTITGDPDALERAISNLIDNAAKWSPDGRTIDVHLHDRQLTVHDDGPGIPAQDLPHVFDRFYRAANAQAIPGSGLGLAIVRQTIENHGASVTAEAPPNGGTTIRITL